MSFCLLPHVHTACRMVTSIIPPLAPGSQPLWLCAPRPAPGPAWVKCTAGHLGKEGGSPRQRRKFTLDPARPQVDCLEITAQCTQATQKAERYRYRAHTPDTSEERPASLAHELCTSNNSSYSWDTLFSFSFPMGPVPRPRRLLLDCSESASVISLSHSSLLVHRDAPDFVYWYY